MTPKPAKEKSKSKSTSKPAPATKPKAARKTAAKTITVSDSSEADADAAEAQDLDKLFRNMLINDDALYNRILLYEPLPFEELVSRAIAAGVSAKGWRPRLKRFLDLKVSLSWRWLWIV